MTDRIETPRLVLRKARESDLDSIWRNVWCDDRLAATMLWRTTKTREEASERMKRTIKFQADSYSYFVCLRENDEPIGFGGIREISPGLYDETGICIAFDYQNRGYGKELLHALLKLAFFDLGGDAFRYSCFHDNEASSALCKSCGFVYQDSVREIRERDGYEYLCDRYICRKDDYMQTQHS